jgi:hypothetical protein
MNSPANGMTSTMALAIVRNDRVLVDVVSALASMGIGRSQLSLIGAATAPDPGIGPAAKPGEGLAHLADIGEVAVPGLGALIASGPLFATLAGAVVDDPRPTFAGLSLRLIACGVDEVQARRLEGMVRAGGILICAHLPHPALAQAAVDAMTSQGAVEPLICRDDAAISAGPDQR